MDSAKLMLQEMFNYSHHFNQELIAIAEREESHFPENAFKLLNHIVNAEAIWNARINALPAACGVWDIRSAVELTEMDRRNLSESLQIVVSQDIERQLGYKTSKGEPFSNSVRDILFHVVNHSTHHRAQIISELKRAGIAAPICDYIFYKRAN